MADVRVYTYDSLATEQNHVQGELKTPGSWRKGKSMMKAHGHLPEHNDTHTRKQSINTLNGLLVKDMQENQSGIKE